MVTVDEFLLLARFKGELPPSGTTTNPLTGVCSPVLCTPSGAPKRIALTILNVAQQSKRRRKVKVMSVNNRSAGPRSTTDGR